jgi:glycosyltransferase involved in cell wall biosynthesis
MLLLDVTHTSHTRAQTGIQRVTRALAAALPSATPIEPVCYDHFMKSWRKLDADELQNLSGRNEAGSSRGAKWSWAQRLRGHSRRFAGAKAKLPRATGVLCPELFSPRVFAALPNLATQVQGPRVAIFHDAIGLKFPELTPAATVARLPAYLRELADFDGVAAISEDSAASLREFWAWAGISDTPPVEAIALGIEPLKQSVEGALSAIPRVLCVSTIEGRKNHTALLDAAEMLWSENVAFELELIGLPRPDTAGAALERIAHLRERGRSIVMHGTVNEIALRAAYARASFTVYPSLLEGFGMPVWESLQYGKPCICSGRGALGESARGGGCLTVEPVDAKNLAGAMRRLLLNRTELNALSAVARARKFRSWTDYAADLQRWIATLS